MANVDLGKCSIKQLVCRHRKIVRTPDWSSGISGSSWHGCWYACAVSERNGDDGV